MAWHIAGLPRLRQMPDLHELTGEKPPPLDPELLAERRLETLRAWKAALRARRNRTG
jgi:hypothetical protein